MYRRKARQIKIECADFGPPYERCCFCRQGTPYWSVKQDVACCTGCAETHHEYEVPTKEEWWNKERHFEILSKEPQPTYYN